MDDHVHGWMWSHPGDDKYRDLLPMEHNDADTGEPYVDSLSQLNKIVERILPDKSPLSLMSVRPKIDIPVSLKRSFVDHRDCSRELLSRKMSSLSSCATEISMDSPVKHPPLSMMPSVGIQDSLRLKALRPSDSLNDSAYETYCGDASNDAPDSMDRTAKADELSSGNDPADYCVSPSGRRSEDDLKPLCVIGEKKAGMISRSLIKDAGGELVISSNFAGDGDSERRSKSLESGILVGTNKEQDEEAEQPGAFHSESESEQPALRVAERLLSNKCQNGSYCNNILASSDLSTAGKLSELGRYVAENKCWTGTNQSVHVSPSLHVADPGSALSSCDSKPQGSLTIGSSCPAGGRIGNLHDGSSAGGGDEEVKTFNCPHCAYSASKKGQVRKHLSVHGIFLCAHCEFACDRADLLEEHRRARHPGLCGRRLCKKCRVLFQSSELEAHELQCTGEKQRWACHTCGKEFKFLSVMKAHAHKWHPPPDDGVSAKPVDTMSDTASSKPCSVSSGPPSVSLNPTQPDTVIGREMKQFQCSECGKMFKTKWTLSNHALSHAGADTPFCCDIDGCSGVTFRSDKELNCHRMAVHRLGPTKYECSQPGCTMQFAKYGHFKRHQLTHAASVETDLSSTDASERKFVCDWKQCGKAFSHSDNLRVHYRRHTDEKPHHCHHCEAAYRQKSGLKYHLDKVHGEKTIGRCGRKRKLDVEDSGILASSNQVPSSGAFVSSGTGEFCAKAERSGQTLIMERDTADSIRVNVKHTALSKMREMSIDVSDLQTNQRTKSDSESTAEGRRWSLPESLSQDCDDNLDNIDINDEWLLDEEDGFITNHRKPPEAGVTTEEVKCEPAGSTSDTEPLDEHLCEELRKLTDAINGEVLSPRGLDSMSPFDSPDGAAYVASKSDCIGDVLPHMSSPHSGVFRGFSNDEEQAAVFDRFSSNVTDDFCPKHPDVAVTVVSKSNMLLHGQGNSANSEQTEVVNGYLADGYCCPDVHPAHFDRSSSVSESTHLPVDGPDMVEPMPCHSSPFKGSVHPWSVPLNSSRWSSHSHSNPVFIEAHGVPSTSGRLSAESGFGSQICREDGTYPSLMSEWLPAENNQPWLGHDAIVPRGWYQRHLASMTGQTDVSRRYDWHVGQHAESPFSRSGTAFDVHVGFESGRQTSPKPCVPYRADVREVLPMPDHFIDSLTGKHSGIYPTSGIGHMAAWSDLYGRSSHMTGIGNYESGLPRHVYRSPVQSDHFYLTSGYSGMQSHTSYERGVETAEGSYGISNSTHRIPPVHAPSWPVPGLSDAGESLRTMPDAQQSSMLYNVVPRYY